MIPNARSRYLPLHVGFLNQPSMSLINRLCGTKCRNMQRDNRSRDKESRIEKAAPFAKVRRGHSWADTRGVVSESAGYRTWSSKLLIVPKSLVTIATIIHRTSSIILHTENPVMCPIHFLASSSSTFRLLVLNHSSL